MNRLKRKNVGRDGHWYQLLDERTGRYEYAPGVTTILGRGRGIKFDIPSGWAARICADYVVEHREWLAGAPSDADLHDLVRSQPRNTTREAQIKGTTIHAYAETLHNEGTVELEAEHEQWAPHVEAYADCLDRWDITPTAVEIPLAHSERRWAGTSDIRAIAPRIVRLLNEWNAQAGRPPLPEDAPGILDIKTGKAIRDKDKVQVVAYAHADLVQIGGVEQPSEPLAWAGLIHVQEEAATLHLIRPTYWDDLYACFNNAHQQWLALDEKRGWLQHAVDNADEPLEPTNEAAA
jgi:hypothetical protein